MEGLPVITTITSDNGSENDIANLGSHIQLPLYYPFSAYINGYQANDAWWDNLVSEQLETRLPVIMLSEGSLNGTAINPTEMQGPGNMNPRFLTSYINALHRVHAENVVKFGCFAEGAVPSTYNNYYGTKGALVDFANQDSWNQIWWQRLIKPWFDSIPDSYRYKINGRVPIEFWGLNINSSFTNQQGNISQLFNYLATQLAAPPYNVTPCFIMGSLNCDTTLANCPYMLGDNEWFSAPSTPFTMTAYKGNTWGGLVSGYLNPNYWVQGNSAYQNPNGVLPRAGIPGKGVNGYNGDTLRDGLDAAVANKSIFNVIEGYNDISESSGMYRSLDSNWDYPSQYLRILSSYADLRTVTQRLLAAGCDENNATTGNLGGAFFRPGSNTNLSVRSVTGPVVISSSNENSPYHYDYQAFDGLLYTCWMSKTTAPAWLQYDYGAGNSEVVTGYYICNSTFPQGYDPSAWQLQGSNDGTTWTTLDSQSGQTFSGRNIANQYTFTNSTSYESYRLNVTANYGGSTFQIGIAELKLIVSGSNGGGWAVTNTTAGQYIQWDDVNFSAGNYKFPLCYSSTAPHTVTLSIDGVIQPSTLLSSTGGMNTFTAAYVGTTAVMAGVHDVRLTFVDGGPDVQWLFIKKYDPLVVFSSAATNCYLTAESGGGNTTLNIVSNRPSTNPPGSWEKFSVDDLAGADTIRSGDAINLQVWNGLYASSTNGGGSTLTDRLRGAPGQAEGFRIIKVSGSGALQSGDQVVLRSSDAVHYVTTESNGSVDVTGTSIGAPQTFTITLYNQ